MSARIRPGACVGGELHRLGAGAGDADHVVAEALDQGFEIHGDQRLVLDDEDVGGHVGGELAAGLVDEVADRLHVDVEDARRLPPRQKPSRQESRNACRGSGVICPMRTSAGRSRWICSLRPLTESEFQMRVKTWNRSTLTFPAATDGLRLAHEGLESGRHIGVAGHLAAGQRAGVAAKIRQVLDDKLSCRHSLPLMVL